MTIHKTSRNFYPVVLIFGAMLVIVLVLVMLYMLERLQAVEDVPPQPELSVVGPAADTDRDGWRPLFNGHTLDGWEITNFGPQGPVDIWDSAIVLSMGDGATGITWTGDFPVTGYEISLEAIRLQGHDFFCGLTFPVGEGHCTLITGGWGGTLVGISSIDGIDASENFTRTSYPFANDHWYQIRVKADNESIRCYIDDDEVVTVPVPGHLFSVRPEVGLSRPLGIATWVTTGAVRKIRYREL